MRWKVLKNNKKLLKNYVKYVIIKKVTFKQSTQGGKKNNMITFKWLRGGTFQVLKDGEGIGVFNPSTKKDSKVSFDSKFTGDKEKEKNKIVNVFFESMATA